ncbi:hypothetical protein IGI04_006630, partial [Brassica rapa subsp. trilocularis]
MIQGFAFRVSVSSEKPRNIPRLFRGSRIFKSKTTFCGLNNTYITPIKCLRLIMKEYLQFGKKFDVLKPQTCVPRNFLGIFRGNSEEQYKLIEIHAHDILFLGIFSFNRANKPPNISRKLKLKILREFRRKISKYSEEVYPSGYSDDIFLGIFRGLSDELVVFGISSEIHFFGIPSEISEGFPRKMNFRGLFSS